LPETELAFPEEQRLAVGADDNVLLLEYPQAPLTAVGVGVDVEPLYLTLQVITGDVVVPVPWQSQVQELMVVEPDTPNA
jgi:hypothetical protein